MTHKDHAPIIPAPLGEIPDLYARDKKRRLSFPHLPIEAYPEVCQAIDWITEGINVQRAAYLIGPMNASTENIRLIQADQWHKFEKMARLKKNGGACWDALTEICFMAFEEKLHNQSLLEKMDTYYKIAHELGHKANPLTRYNDGGVDTLFDISEGLADLTARNALEIALYPRLFSKEDMLQRTSYAQYLDDTNQTLKSGITPSERDILAYDPTKGGIFYSYPVQVRALDTLEQTQPELFAQVRKAGFLGDIPAIRTLLPSLEPPFT